MAWVMPEGRPSFENIAHPHELEIAQHGRDALGDDGRQRNAGNAHAQTGHEPDVQADVQDGRNDEEHQRRSRVAHTAEDARQDVIENEACAADEEDAQIVGAPVDDGGRGVQQFQQGTGYQRADDQAEQRSNGRQGDTVADGPGQALAVAGAEPLGDQDARAGGNTYEQRQQQVEDGTGAANGGQGVVADIFANHDGVHRVIKLLGNIAQDHGHGKLSDALPGRARRHILCRKQITKFQSGLPFRHKIPDYIIRHFPHTGKGKACESRRKVIK